MNDPMALPPPTDPTAPEIFTVSDVSRIYHVSPRTVFEWIYRGLLVPSIKIGNRTRRFTREDLANLERSGK